MFSTIIACIIANLLTIVIIGAAIYFVYKKNQDKIEELKTEIKEKIAETKDKIADVKDDISGAIEVINSIKNALDKLPFGISNEATA